MFHFDTVFNVFQTGGLLQFFEDHVAVRWKHRLPVMMFSQVRCMDQDVQGLSCSWGHFVPRERRCTDIAGRVSCGFSLLVDLLKLNMWILTEHKIVMQKVLVFLTQAEVQHDARAGRLVLSLREKPLGYILWQELFTGADTIRIRHHGLCFERVPIVQRNPRDMPCLAINRDDFTPRDIIDA